MKPEFSLPDFNPERISVNGDSNINRLPEQNNSVGLEQSAEKYEKKSEVGAIVSEINTASIFPAPIAKDVNVVPVATSISDGLMTLNDDEAFEKELVNRAKRVIADNRDDPYAQNRGVSEIRVEYRKTHSEKEIGSAK